MTDDILGPLRDAPVPPLPPGATVRARGEQRTRRRRAVVAGAAAAVVLAAGVTLAGPGGTDELRPAPFATAAPTIDPLDAALLDPADLAQVLSGEWDDLPNESPFSVPLVGCPATALDVERGAARFLTDGERIAGQALSLHPDDAAADERYQQVLASLRACGESSPTYRLFGEGGDTSTRTYGEVLTPDEPTRPFSLERVGRTVVTLVLQGPPEPSPELTQAAADEVRAELGDDEPGPSASPGPSPVPASPEPARDWWLPDAFLTPELAAQAEDPGWTVDASHTPDVLTPVADPCQGEGLPLGDEVRDQGERSMGSTREHGGSSVLQEVYRYSSATAAGQALAEYEQRYYRCAAVQDPHADDGWTIHSEVVQRELAPHGGTVLVRRVPCTPEGYCTDHFSTYAMLAREGNGLTVVAYTIAEDGDPAQEARALVRAVHDRLREAVRG